MGERFTTRQSHGYNYYLLLHSINTLCYHFLFISFAGLNIWFICYTFVQDVVAIVIINMVAELLFFCFACSFYLSVSRYFYYIRDYKYSTKLIRLFKVWWGQKVKTDIRLKYWIKYKSFNQLVAGFRSVQHDSFVWVTCTSKLEVYFRTKCVADEWVIVI